MAGIDPAILLHFLHPWRSDAGALYQCASRVSSPMSWERVMSSACPILVRKSMGGGRHLAIFDSGDVRMVRADE